MIKKKMILSSFVVLVVMVMAFAPLSARAEDAGYAPWLIPVCPLLELQYDALTRINNVTGSHEVIINAVTSFTQAECQCDDALDFTVFFIEDALRRGTSLNMHTNGVFYSSLLQVSAAMAQTISGSALSILADNDISLTRQLNVNINFISAEQNALDISFPEDVSDIEIDIITIETEFAAVSLERELISGSALRIERGVPVASSTPATVAADGISSRVIRGIFDFWAVAALMIIMVIWGVLASTGRKLRLWVVPFLAVILIFANIWTLGLNQRGREDVIYTPAPVYFYSIMVTMSPEMNAILSVPLGGTSPEMLMLVNEWGEPMVSRYNPFTDTIDARIYAGGMYYLQVVDISG
ncbi:MAG: hypothetical protein FWC77_07490 [Defluviitaleaceae bacterium]|nr:hypothetical protein [Defluviitaleaceae bacterium]